MVNGGAGGAAWDEALETGLPSEVGDPMSQEGRRGRMGLGETLRGLGGGVRV